MLKSMVVHPTCAHCGDPIVGRGSRARYCSKPCNYAAWYARNREGQIARMKTYREANPEIVRAAAQSWKERNRPAARRIARDGYARNPETAKRSARNRRARESGVETLSFTDKDWRGLLRAYRGQCAWCGSRDDLQRDHVIPLARGGRHAVGNIVPACRSCNAGRRDRLAVEWRRHLARRDA